MQARHKRFTAPIAKDCQGKFKNKEICHIFKNTLLNDMLFQEDSLDEQRSVKYDLLEYVENLSSKKLYAIEQELASKKNLSYNRYSYCVVVESYVWYGLKYQEEDRDWSLQKSWARTCNYKPGSVEASRRELFFDSRY